MEKTYTFNLTDEEAMHILLAVDAWRSEQKKEARDARERELKLFDNVKASKYKERYLTSDKLAKKLLKIVGEQNQEFDMKKMWKEVMFDV